MFFYPRRWGEKYLDVSNTLLLLHPQITSGDGPNLAQDARVAVINYPVNTPSHRWMCQWGTDWSLSPTPLHPPQSSERFNRGCEFNRSGGLHRSGSGSRLQRDILPVSGPLHADTFFWECLLSNSIDLRIKLTDQRTFCLMSNTDADSE